MTTGKENPHRPRNASEAPNPLSAAEQESQLLLGRPCKPGIREGVVSTLSSMEPERRTLVYDWAMFPMDNLLFMAYDHVTNYTDQDRKRENTHAQTATTEYLDGMLSWLSLVRTSEKVPMLEYEEPEDKVGEPIDWFVWTLDDGGAADQLFAEQIEYVEGKLGKYKDYVAGRVRMIQLPNSIVDHMPQETQEEKRQKEAEKFAEAVIKLLELLEPHIKHLNDTLLRLGIDPDTLEPMNNTAG